MAVCEHGVMHGEYCSDCTVQHVRRIAEQLMSPAQYSPEARAQLWGRVYAAEFELYRRRDGSPLGTVVYERSEASIRETTALACAQTRAREAADAAVRDFDEHYLGGKR
jgi:hypothetical protein